MVNGSQLMVNGLWFRVDGFELMVKGLGFRV
jgi:hypothetical protein